MVGLFLKGLIILLNPFEYFLKKLQLNSLHFLCFMIFQFILYNVHNSPI